MCEQNCLQNLYKKSNFHEEQNIGNYIAYKGVGIAITTNEADLYGSANTRKPKIY